MNVSEEKLKSRFHSSEELMNEFVGPAGSSERKAMEERASAWFYGEILRDRRKTLKMSQTSLAERIGVKQSYIARIEKGEVDLQLSSLLRIANALGLQLRLQ